MPISIAIYQANGSRSPRHQFPEEEADKEARRKMRSNRGNNVAKSCANSTTASMLARGSLFADDILSRKYRLRPSHRRREESSGAIAVRHGDSLKDILDDRLSARTNNEGDIRVPLVDGGERNGRKRERKIPQLVIRGMHNQDSAGSKRARACTHLFPGCLFCLVPR